MTTSVIILAGGFGERTKGILQDKPKLLIKTSDDKTILDYIFSDLKASGPEVIIVTNGLFYDQIDDYVQEKYPENGISILNDKRMEAVNRLGALGDLLFAVDVIKKPENDVLVMPSDTAYWKSFSITEFIDFTMKHQNGFATVAYDIGDKEKIKNNLGCVVLGEDSELIDFEEKPVNPKSTLAILAIYLFRPEHIKLLREFKKEGGDLNSPSNIIPFLMKKGIKIFSFLSKGNVIDANGPEEISQVVSYPQLQTNR